MNQFLSLSIYCSGSSSRVCYRDSSKYVKCSFQVLNTGIRVWEPWPTCLVRHSPSKHIVTQSSLIYEINVSFFDFWSCSNCRIIWQTTWWPLLLLSFFYPRWPLLLSLCYCCIFLGCTGKGPQGREKGPFQEQGAQIGFGRKKHFMWTLYRIVCVTRHRLHWIHLLWYSRQRYRLKTPG